MFQKSNITGKNQMKKLYLVLLTGLLFNTAAYATECKVVEDQISEKIKANGVAEFTLTSVDKGSVTDQKIVGVCDGGKKDIIYTRGKSATTEQTTTQEQSTN